MFKKLGKLLKKGAMSVEYIVIGVCVIGMAALATTFISNKMSVAMGQENSDTSGGTNAGTGGNTNTGDNTSTPNTPKIETESDFFEAYGIHTGEYYSWKGEYDGVDYGYDTSSKCVITMDGKVNFYKASVPNDLYLSAMLDLNNNTFHIYDSENGQDRSEYINSFEVEINVVGSTYESDIHYIQVKFEERSYDGMNTRDNYIYNDFKSCFFTEDNCE